MYRTVCLIFILILALDAQAQQPATANLTGRVVDADGSNLKMLTSDSYYPEELCWSPEGAKIAFVRSVDKIGDKINIFQVDSDGRNLMRLTVGPTQDRHPSLSPDGSKLAFQSNRDGNYEIYVMNLRTN